MGPQFGASRASRFTAAVVLTLCGYAASAWSLVCGEPTCGLNQTIQAVQPLPPCPAAVDPKAITWCRIQDAGTPFIQ